MIGAMDSVNELTEVLPCPRLTVMPKLQKYVIGVAHIRGQTISVIDLAYAIGGRPSTNIEKCFIIIAEYNRSTHAFLVSNVERILNMNWDKIMPPPKGAGDSNYMTAVTEIDGELVEILDVEKILEEISPSKLDQQDLDEVYDDEYTKIIEEHKPKVLIADDSKVALNQVCYAMEKMNLEVVKSNDGREAYEILRQ